MIPGLKKCTDCKATADNCEEYQLKAENDRLKLHLKYICFIAGSIFVWLIATKTADNEDFTAWISFASTITSIILSVLAIIMSISGENKSEVARNQLEETSKKIDLAVESMEGINRQTTENIDSIDNTLRTLNEKIESMDLRIQEYTKSNQSSEVKVSNNFSGSNTKWGNRNGKKVEH